MKNLSTMELWRRPATWLAPVLTGLALMLVPSGAAQAQALPLAPASARAVVPEAGDYGILYQMDIPDKATFNSTGVPYSTDKSAVEMVNPARVAYYLELTNGATTTYVWTSMANFATNLTQLGIPNPTSNNVSLHQNVSSLNVFSNVAGVTTGTNLGTGRIEMWPTNYSEGNYDQVPGADPTTFDFGDRVNSIGDYGSFQVHNVTAKQTVFAYNNWGGSGFGRGYGDLGIGSQPGGNAKPDNPDWTHQVNAKQYSVKRITILVKTPANNALTDLVVSTGTQTNPTPIPAGAYNSITVTQSGNGVLAGIVTVNSFLSVEPGGGLSDGCSVISGPGSFTLGAGSILGICNAAGITSSGPTGAVLVTGTRSFSTGASYGYTGAAAAAVTGNGLPGTVASLAINTAGNVALTAPVAVTVAVGVGGAGNLVLDGNALTLLSSASGTALAVNSSTGVVMGTATVQRYIDPSLNPGLGYRHYSAPVSGATVANLATAGFTPVLTAGYNTSATPGTTTPFPTVFAYDQARLASTMNNLPAFDKGFVVPVSTDVPLAVGQGYAVNIDAAQLVSFVGTLTTGTQTVKLARTGGATAADGGWALVGNPYPAPLDLSLITLGDRPGLDAAMYVFESNTQYTGMYRSYVNSVGTMPRSARTNGALSSNSFIGSSQGFFVRVSAGLTSGSLTFRDAQRMTSYATPVPVRRSSADRRPVVQLELRGATGPADTFYAYAEAGATPAFDSQFDAQKLPNTTGLNLASRAEGAAEGLAIDARPAFTAATVLPLTVGVPAAGAYTLSAAALTNLPAGLDAYLHDAVTGQTLNLRQQPRYAFAVSPAQAQAGLSTRFSLGFSPQAILATHAGLHAGEVSLFPNPARDSFTVLVPAVTGTSQLRAELLNALGQVVRRLSAALPADGASLRVDTAGLAGGVYILRLSAGPTTLTKRVVLH